MFASELRKHWSEVRRNIQRFKFERAPAGLFLPSMGGAMIRGQFREWPNDEIHLAGIHQNLVVDEGMNYVIDAALLGGTQIAAASFYMALHSGSAPPAAGWDGSDYATNATEITATGPEGFTPATRPAWTGVANAGNTSADNSAAPAQVTIVSAGTLDINGAALIGGDNVRGGTTGTLIGAVKYSSTRSLGNADVYNVQYEFDLNTP